MKFDKLRETKDKQPENIYFIFMTFVVLKLFMFKKDKNLHSKNVLFILVVNEFILNDNTF